VVNTHPALCPSFPGTTAPADAIAYGVRVTGATLFVVDEGVDTGPIIAQRAIELTGLPSPEEVHAALRPIEHDLLCGVVEAFAAGAIAADPSNPRRVEYRPVPMGGSQ